MPFLPLYIRQLGVTDVGEIALWTGAALGVTPALAALMSPLWGRLADRFGRKIMLARALVSCVLVMVAMAFVTRAWHVVALRAGLGLFTGYGALALAMAAESAPRDKMTSAIGFVQTAQRLGPAFGPAVGGFLAGWLGLRLSFLMAAAFYVAALVLVLKLYTEKHLTGTTHAATAPNRPGYRAVLQFENMPILMAVIFAVTFIDRSVGPVLALYLEQNGVAGDQIAMTAGLLFSLTAISGALGHHFCSYLVRRFAPSRVIAGAGALIAAATAVYIVGWSPWLMGVAATCLGLGSGIATTAAYSTAGNAIPHEARGVGFGMLTGAALVALAISPILAGLLGTTSLRAVFLVDLLLIAALIAGIKRVMPWARPA